jgi:hypothetical protein
MCVPRDEPEPERDSGTPPDPPDSGMQMPNPDAGGPLEIDCTASDVEGACQAFCEAFCQNQQRFCVDSSCEPGACEPGGNLLAVCTDDLCPGDATCAQEICVGETQRPCEDFGFPDDVTPVYQSGCFQFDPVCVINPDYGCSDTCGSLLPSDIGTGGDLANDNLCEDGGEDAVSSVCARGTDCTDCGQRTCSMVGETCSDHGDCCGYFANDALCGAIDERGNVCWRKCDDGQACPGGLTCQTFRQTDQTFQLCAP